MASLITSLTIVYSTVYSGGENVKVPRHWLLCGKFTGNSWISRTRASNAEHVSIWWRHHVIFKWKLPSQKIKAHIDGILPKGPYPPCLRMADRALLAGYPRYIRTKHKAFLMQLPCVLFSNHVIIRDPVKPFSDVTWASCRLKLPTSRLFIQPLFGASIKEKSKTPLWGNQQVRFPAQKASYAENVPMSWRQHKMWRSRV